MARPLVSVLIVDSDIVQLSLVDYPGHFSKRLVAARPIILFAPSILLSKRGCSFDSVLETLDSSRNVFSTMCF
jgi:hypothetical protein